MVRNGRSRVVLIEPTRQDIDISDATRFGEIVTLFGHRRDGTSAAGGPAVRPRPSTTNLQEFGQAVSDALDEMDFDPTSDYFMFTGGTLQVSMAIVALCARHPTVPIRGLVFSANTCQYVVKLIDFSSMKGDTCTSDTRSRTKG